MASRKMTFTLPEALASSFTRRIPARERSRYVSEAIAGKLADQEKRLIRACESANQDPELKKIEKELEALTDKIPGSWEDAPAR